jgi:hypothetical protein
MAFQDGHYYVHGQTCTNGVPGDPTSSDRFWFPGGTSSDPSRPITWVFNEISYWYDSFFGRYAEEGGANYWYDGFVSSSNGFVNGGTGSNSTFNTSLYTFIFNGGVTERGMVAAYGRHTGMATGNCPIFGCTNPQATNYNPNADTDDGSCILPTGCTDPLANNYDSSATIDDGSCTYTAPQIIFSANPSTIINGQSSTVSWYCVNPTTSFGFISGTISSSNQTGNQIVVPSDTSTWCAQAFGPGGGSGTTCVTVTVLQAPICSLTVPNSVVYGDSTYNIGYETIYATNSIQITPTYNYLDGSQVVGTTVNISPATSSELGDPASSTERNGTVAISMPWNNQGPQSVSVSLNVSGTTTASDSDTFLNIIDRSPDSFTIPQSIDKFIDEDPVISPETEVLSEKILIDDIDIPVEIHANYPVLVDKNSQDVWQGVRQSGLPGVGGNSTFDENQGLISSNSKHSLMRKIAAAEEPNPEFRFNGSNEFSSEVFYSDDPNQEPPLIAKISNAQLAQLVNCISLIDEVSPSEQTMFNDWAAFRTNFPFRTFWLLQAVIQSNGGIRYPLSRLKMPSNYLSDPYANGGIQVRRDDGNASFTSSWFDICNLTDVPEGTYVSLWIDISGSMVYSTIQASYNEFVADCTANGVNIILETSNSGERWIPGHNKTLPPSANFKIIAPNGTAVTTLEIAAGQGVTLAWIVFGDVNNIVISPGVINTNDSNFFYASMIVYPVSDTTYTLNATGPEGTVTITVSVTVFSPPTFFLSANPSTSIVVGQCTNIEWYVTGDADTLIWTQGTITNGNLTSQENVCPGDTTTYCGYVTGTAGDSPTTCITVNVSQFPTCSIDSPVSINYGNDNFDIEYETKYATSSIQITPTYYYLDGSNTVGSVVVVNPATSSELGGTQGQTDRDGVIDWSTVGVPWNNFGPSSIAWTIQVQGTGGTTSASTTTGVIIDRRPDNFIIPPSDDKIRDEEPVESPDTTVLSELILVDGIDIPVEVKANYPIQVDKNLEDNWEGVREI